MAGLYIPLPVDVKRALARLAESELRYPREEAVLIIRQELERRGMLASAPKGTGADHAC